MSVAQETHRRERGEVEEVREKERQTKKMTERKRAREEGLQLQSYHTWPVSDLIFFSFLCARVASV